MQKALKQLAEAVNGNGSTDNPWTQEMSVWQKLRRKALEAIREEQLAHAPTSRGPSRTCCPESSTARQTRQGAGARPQGRFRSQRIW